MGNVTIVDPPLQSGDSVLRHVNRFLLVIVLPAVRGRDEFRAVTPLGHNADAAGLPRDAPSELKRFIGEYRSADAQLTIYEEGGQLSAEGLGMHHAQLRRLSATQLFRRGGQAAADPLGV